MKNLMKTITIIAINLCFCNNVIAYSSIPSIEVTPQKHSVSKSHFKIAKAYWLPDYTAGVATIINSGSSSEAPKSCKEAGLIDAKDIPANKTCTKTFQVNLTCYKDCICAPKYTHSSSELTGYKLNDDCCDGKCSGVIACEKPEGWSFRRPSSYLHKEIMELKHECGPIYFLCPRGFQPIKNAMYGNQYNLTSCPAHQNYITNGGGPYCAKCENKSCADYNFQDNNDTTINCTAQTPYAGKTCYDCKSCAAQYKYDSRNCKSPNILGTDTCGNKSSECNCPIGITNCQFDCKTHYTGSCSTICKECKTCIPLANETNCSFGTTSCSDDCGGTRTCCKTCETKAAKELFEKINSGVKGVITIKEDIVFCPNTGIVLKDGQSLIGANNTTQKLTFNFNNNAKKAIGIDLANNSSISQLDIDYKTLVDSNDTNFHAIRNNNNKDVTIKDVNITVKGGSYYTNTAGIANFGEINLLGNINILTKSGNSSGIYNKATSSLTQDKSSTLNIKTNDTRGCGIIGGKNNLNGTVNIITQAYADGIKDATNNISSTSIINIQSSLFGHAIENSINNVFGKINIKSEYKGISNSTNNISGVINIQTSGLTANGIENSDNEISGTLNIETKLSGNGIYKGKNKILRTGIVNIKTKDNGIDSSTNTIDGKVSIRASHGINGGANTLNSSAELLINNMVEEAINAVLNYNTSSKIGIISSYHEPGKNINIWEAKKRGKLTVDVIDGGTFTLKDHPDFKDINNRKKMPPFPSFPKLPAFFN